MNKADYSEVPLGLDPCMESKKQLEMVIEGTGVGIWDWHIPTGAVSFNERWAEIIGYTLEELKPVSIETWLRFAHPDDLQESGRLLDAHWRGETERYVCESRMLHKQGHWIWVLDSGKVVEWASDGKPLRMVGTHLDITRQKEAELQLGQTANLLNNVLNAATEMSIIATDPQGMITIFNPGSERLLGYTAAEMVGKQSPAILHVSSEVAARGQALTAELGYPVEGFRVFVEMPEKQGSERRDWTYVRKDGSCFPVSLVVTTMRGPQGDVIGYLGMAEDITERRRAEDALRQSEARLRGLFQLSPVGIALNDMETGTFLAANDALVAPTGYTTEEFLRLSYWDLTPRDYEAQEAMQLQHLHASGRYGPYEKEYFRKDGSRYPVLLRGIVVHDTDGKSYIWSIIEDMTERKRIDRMKNEFISIVSHELRTPLTAISGALGLAIGGALGALPEELEKIIRIADSNSRRLTFLINDLLDMEKLVTGNMHFDMHVQPLKPLLEQAIETNRVYGSARLVSLEAAGAQADALVRVDAGRLQQVLSNLLSNAIKFSPDGGVVTLSSCVEGGYVKVRVQDQGPGIPQQFRSRIFKKFSQADSSDSRQKGGTGLGLAISKELIERMNGKIGFDSKEGEGACFHFELPVLRRQKA